MFSPLFPTLSPPPRSRLAAVIGCRRHCFHESLGGLRPRRCRHRIVTRQLLAHVHPRPENECHFPVDVPHVGQSRPLRHFLDGFRHLVTGGESGRVFEQTREHERSHRVRPCLRDLFGRFRERLPKVSPLRSRLGRSYIRFVFFVHRIPRKTTSPDIAKDGGLIRLLPDFRTLPCKWPKRRRN